ncbi:sigma-70 family RNA polymerase sigma factor [Candidatus Nasuia deltocephalinicola]|uniref:sigma-70 family RNA polymerase sigma factor n=1 Tax=Candidatus Nasuia deltocephalincola TaxID=1160784 RepID=UPI00216AD1F0|nr:sigma-70 family RNA polymerase sigma factor [Candidatus Nasuia deltocephalinicola]
MKINHLNKILKYYFSESINFKNYKNNIIKIINYCKKNFNFLTYNKFFYIFKNIDLNDLNKIIFIIKLLKIKIVENLPYKYILLNNYKYNNYNNNNNNSYFYNNKKNFKNLKKNKILKYYKYINKNLVKISKNFTKNIFLVSSIFKLKKNIRLKKLIYKIKSIKSNLIFLNNFNFYKNSKKNNYTYKNLPKDKMLLIIKKIFTILNFLTSNISNFRKNKNYYEKIIIIKFLKKKFIKFKINLEMIDDFYYFLNKKNKLLFKIKSKIYDNICNLIDLSYIEFNFYFLKYGSNLSWIKNIIDFKYFDINFKNKFLKFLKKKSKKIKILEKKYSTKFYYLFKIFNYIENKKLKIDIIRNNIVRLKLNIVSNLTKKYKRNSFYNDCFQEGSVALIKSVNSYNMYLKYSFENFARYNIRKSINNFIYKINRIIKIPQYISETFKKIYFFCKNYKKKYNIEPSLDCISKNLDIDKIKIKKILNYNKTPISMTKIINEEEYEGYFEYKNNNNYLNFEKDIFHKMLKNKISKIIKIENYKSYPDFINMRYGLNGFKKFNLKEIAKMYNMSKNKISALKNDSLIKMRKYFPNI